MDHTWWFLKTHKKYILVLWPHLIHLKTHKNIYFCLECVGGRAGGVLRIKTVYEKVYIFVRFQYLRLQTREIGFESNFLLINWMENKLCESKQHFYLKEEDFDRARRSTEYTRDLDWQNEIIIFELFLTTSDWRKYFLFGGAGADATNISGLLV